MPFLELKAEAIKRGYKLGTKFIAPDTGSEWEIKGDLYPSAYKDSILVYVEVDSLGQYICCNGKWAIIINQPEPEFVLPKKWAVKKNGRNHEVVNAWINDLLNTSKYSSIEGFIYSEDIDNSCFPRSNSTLIKGFIEITFEQFKKYVMKEQKKKIIAYEVIKIIPFRIWKIGDKIEPKSSLWNSCKDYPEFLKPIYEDKNLYIGDNKDYGILIDSKGAWIDGINYPKEFIEKVAVVLNCNTIKSLNVGCSGQFIVTKELINKILNKLNIYS